VECIWSGETSAAPQSHAVLPDGCLDIVYSRQTGLQVVGAMSAPRVFDIPVATVTLGIRFRPGMAGGFHNIAAAELTDRVIALEDVAGRTARELARRLQDADLIGVSLEILRTALRAPHAAPDPVRRAIDFMTQSHGAVDLDWVAGQAGLSPRQFRRRCLEASGLSPRHLCRVLRFRRARALSYAGGRPDWAQIAAEAGYYDQAHLIRDFREFAGNTPMAVFSNPSGSAAR